MDDKSIFEKFSLIEHNEKKGLSNYCVKVNATHSDVHVSLQPTIRGIKSETYSSLGIKFPKLCPLSGEPAYSVTDYVVVKKWGLKVDKNSKRVSLSIPTNFPMFVGGAMKVEVHPIFSEFYFLLANKTYAEVFAKINNTTITPMSKDSFDKMVKKRSRLLWLLYGLIFVVTGFFVIMMTKSCILIGL